LEIYIFENKVKHLKGINLFKRVRLWQQRIPKKKEEKFEKKTLRKMEKESFNWTPKSISMRCYQKEAQNWKEVLEGKLEFELMYYVYHFMYVSILFTYIHEIYLIYFKCA
jgi:hypothetical protein